MILGPQLAQEVAKMLDEVVVLLVLAVHGKGPQLKHLLV